MQIGELAKRTGTDVETVRYYERAGLLAKPLRNASGYRQYGGEHQERLQFIRHCRSLQMSLADIGVLLDLQSNPAAGCHRVNELLDHHIERIHAQAEALRKLELQLTKLRQECGEPHVVKECAIIQSLAVATESHKCACHAQRKRAGKSEPTC